MTGRFAALASQGKLRPPARADSRGLKIALIVVGAGVLLWTLSSPSGDSNDHDGPDEPRGPAQASDARALPPGLPEVREAQEAQLAGST